MNDNNFNDEFFTSKPEEPKEPVLFGSEEPEKINEEKAEPFIPVKEFEQSEIKEAVFENAEQKDNDSSFFQNYPRPEIKEPNVFASVEEMEQKAEEKAEDVFSSQNQVNNSFNPYAPKENTISDASSQVNPSYTNLNGSYQRPEQPQQGQYQNGGYYGNYQQSPNYNQHWQANASPEAPKKNKGKTVLGIILIVCLCLAVVGLISGLVGGNKVDNEITTTTAPSQSQGVISGPAVTSENIEVSTTQAVTSVVNSVYVADKVRPSVVGVMTYYEGKLAGEGSGVLMSEKDGWTYIVTCAHVISEDNVSYGILLLDGRRFEAQLVAYDTRTDIGVVKVEATGLPLAEFGDSTTLRVGEPVYAIGNPGGSEYFGSITNGIVSAIDRSVTSTYTMTCIQHNAAINPGNSGGALVNAAGQVIGINSSKIASTEYEGMGFAVPTSIASPIVDSLIQYGYVPNRPKLGIEYAPVSSYQLYSLVVSIKGLPQGSLVIAGISEDSSLAGTQAEVGDLIIAVNGKNMDDSSVLLDLIETGSVGDTLKLTLCRIESRTYKTSTFDVTISLVEDKPSATEKTEPSTQYQDDGYYRGGAGSFEDFFNEYFGW